MAREDEGVAGAIAEIIRDSNRVKQYLFTALSILAVVIWHIGLTLMGCSIVFQIGFAVAGIIGLGPHFLLVIVYFEVVLD